MSESYQQRARTERREAGSAGRQAFEMARAKRLEAQRLLIEVRVL